MLPGRLRRGLLADTLAQVPSFLDTRTTRAVLLHPAPGVVERLAPGREARLERLATFVAPLFCLRVLELVGLGLRDGELGCFRLPPSVVELVLDDNALQDVCALQLLLPRPPSRVPYGTAYGPKGIFRTYVRVENAPARGYFTVSIINNLFDPDAIETLGARFALPRVQVVSRRDVTYPSRMKLPVPRPLTDPRLDDDPSP